MAHLIEDVWTVCKCLLLFAGCVLVLNWVIAVIEARRVQKREVRDECE